MDTLISLILPIYNEGKNLEELYQRSRAVLEKIGDYEIIFINDGSSDDSLETIVSFSRLNSRIKLVDFSRNFGHQIAITAGLDFARGDAVIIMDSDLQDTPEAIAEMVEKWREGFDVVYAKRRTRQDGFFKKATAFIFYRILKKLANIDIPEDTGDFRLMDKKVVSEMRRLREHARFMRGLTSWVGFRQTCILFDRADRRHGSTGYPFGKMLKFAIDGLTAFSHIPLKLAGIFGYFVAVLSVLGILYALYRKLFYPAEVISGWTFTIITVLFIGSVQLIFLAILGEYVGRIYTESQNRPLYVVRQTLNMNSQDSPVA